MSSTGRNFSLTEHQRQFVDQQVAAGRHVSGSEVVREALRRYESDLVRERAHLDYLERLADAGEAAYQRGDYVELDRDGLKVLIGSFGRQA